MNTEHVDTNLKPFSLGLTEQDTGDIFPVDLFGKITVEEIESRLQTLPSGPFQNNEEVKNDLCRAQRNKETIVESAFPLVIIIAEMYKGLGFSLPELIHEGNIGLMMAWERFDKRGGREEFKKYAARWIGQSISKALEPVIRASVNSEIRRFEEDYGYKPSSEELAATSGLPLERVNKVLDSLPERISVHTIESINKLVRVQKKLLQEFEREPTLEEISTECGWSVGRVRKVFAWAQMPPTTLANESIEEDIIKENAEKVASYASLQERLNEVFSVLNEPERAVIEQRFGLKVGLPYTQKDVSRQFNMPHDRICQIESDALRKLRLPARISFLDDFFDGDFSSERMYNLVPSTGKLDIATRVSLTQDLIQAIRVGNLSEVKRLVAAGAEAGTAEALESEFFYYDEDCPLSVAIEENREDIVRFLYEHGASTGYLLPNANHKGVGAFELAIKHSGTNGDFNPAILSLIVENTPDINETVNPPLALCAEDDKYALIVPYLLAHGADPNRRNKSDEGMTPLHICAENNSVKVAEILLRHGAYIDALHGSYTPLMWAFVCSNEEIARLLIAHGASLDDMGDCEESASAEEGNSPEEESLW